ncbi:hypothetical protein ACFFTK_08965 [Pseudonocardia petroleophila]|uniref:Uncharacterized protein n=1 Tax=Pseudonocardia petroleophila TaxID=37331 RepID=A0A7G7MFU7_9PSEU|nr:hypothetical protein [Pseudonocardia petroleophila]QNG51658.1 hypothetical protein H6H00_26720 [Pseudonocardia petroleophila]
MSSDPAGLSTGDAGRVWFNTTTSKFMYWNGTAAIDALARANHSGSQLATTISDLAATVKAYRLDEFAAPTSPVSLGGQRITNQADPTGAQDSATKNYVDTALAGLASGQVLKGAVRVAATTNVNIASAPSSVDGVTLAASDVVLLTGQSTGSQNGPYVFTSAGAALTRATNWDSSPEAVLGSYWIVREGTNADTFALLTNDSAITLGTTALTFVFRGLAGSTYTAGNGLTLTGNDFNVGAGNGISVAADSVAVDPAVVGRKITGLIPASSSGIFSISGAVVTVNHGLNNACPAVVVRYGATPLLSGSEGQLVEVDNQASDANNIVIMLPSAPATGNYKITIVG